MNAATLQKGTEVERAVLTAAEPGVEYKPLDLAERALSARNAAWDRDLVLEAIWRLISLGRLRLTPRRTLSRR
jgi:hypothetical protein